MQISRASIGNGVCLSRECVDGQNCHAAVGQQSPKPYVDNAPEGIVPILFLDSYRCQIMSLVVNAVKGLGVEVEHIPGSCTYLCQPVDVGVNKPYRMHLHEKWESWMFAEGIIHGTTSPPTRKHIAEWAIHANNTLAETTIKNAWRHGNYSWFPQQNSNNSM